MCTPHIGYFEYLSRDAKIESAHVLIWRFNELFSF